MTTVKLMPEYSVEVPLWGDDGLIEPGDLPLSESLLEALTAWSALFQEHHRVDSGWLDGSAREEFASSAEVLLTRLRAELGPAYDVVADLWPLD